MSKPRILKISPATIIQWLLSRVGVIYVIVFLFCLTCVDLKMLETRIKVRHLNDTIPDFSDMIIFSKNQNAKVDINWKQYKNYFELILSYIPDDVITKQLLGYVDYYSGQEDKAIALLKSTSVINQLPLFWPNYNLGVIYYKKGMWQQASVYLLSAIESNPQLTMLLMHNSLVYKQIFISPYFKYPLNEGLIEAKTQAYILLMSSLQKMHQYEKGILIFNSTMADQQLLQRGAFYYYAGLAYFENGQLEKAFLLFQESIKMEKDNPESYYYIADIYQKAGQLPEAHEFLQASYLLHQKNDPRFPYDAHPNLRFL